ncbi:MAG TPA: BamA/TamA family outer membrane protein, partial [Rubricoccaceae bacterium]|nr:BamA/TamA family outer membrane protein [Rubricoccaceae bacterium]
FAGGTNDVRGWGQNLLGPKFLDLVPDTTLPIGFFPGSSGYTAPRYYALGGGTKVSGSLQANLPLPLGPQWGAALFVDGGVVWAPGARDLLTLFAESTSDADRAFGALLLEEDGVPRFGTGAGIQYLTPVGYVNLALGVKVNPSYFDLRDPQDVLDELDASFDEGRVPDFDAVPSIWSRRLQLHFSIGQTF